MDTEDERADDALVAEVRDLLVQLGTAMSAAGDSVDSIDSTLPTIVAAYGVEHLEIAVLPTSLIALGVLMGTAAYNGGASGLRSLSKSE